VDASPSPDPSPVPVKGDHKVGGNGRGEKKMETVKLKNGTEEQKPLVIGIFFSMQHLLKEHPIAFYELVKKCRDHTHEFFGNTAEVLMKYSLLQRNGQPHGSISNIVLSAVEGEGFNMTLKSPLEG